MVEKNRIGEVIKNESFVGGSRTFGQNTLYRNWGNGILSPEFMQSVKGDGTPYETKAVIYNVDASGNPTDVLQENGPHISYIWGYNHTKPVAKIENISFGDIPQTLVTAIQEASDDEDQSALETALANLRADSAMSNTMITTFTYYPLIGVRSVTDAKGMTTTYEYDGQGRLKAVRDNDGHLLSENEYHCRTN